MCRSASLTPCIRRKIVSAKPLQRWQLFFTNCQALVDDTHILFPYYRKGGQLCYCYRPLCEYDTAAVRLREITAYTLYMLFRPLWQRQKNWVVYEKFCKTAQDNSYYFFKYCMEHLPEKERRHIYYIMDLGSRTTRMWPVTAARWCPL